MGGVKASSEFDEANFSTTHKVVKELTIEFGKKSSTRKQLPTKKIFNLSPKLNSLNHSHHLHRNRIRNVKRRRINTHKKSFIIYVVCTHPITLNSWITPSSSIHIEYQLFFGTFFEDETNPNIFWVFSNTLC